MPELTDAIVDLTVEHSMRIRSPLTGFPIWQMAGAVARVDEAATPSTAAVRGTSSTSAG